MKHVTGVRKNVIYMLTFLTKKNPIDMNMLANPSESNPRRPIICSPLH